VPVPDGAGIAGDTDLGAGVPDAFDDDEAAGDAEETLGRGWDRGGGGAFNEFL
jgi:hypothetical protein